MATMSTSRPRMRLWPATLGVFIAFVVIYYISLRVLNRVNTPEGSAYFDLLADSFLRGRLFIESASTYDLTQYKGRWYVPFPPLPALLLMPWVAVSGVSGIYTSVFSAVTGAAGAAFAFATVRGAALAGWAPLKLSDQLWLTALFGLGSVNWYLSTIGAVWFMGQVSAAAFMALSLALAIGARSPVGSGIALAIAMLGRPHVALMFPLLLAIALQHKRDAAHPLSIGTLIQKALVIGLPMLLSAGALLAYNAARFDNPLDFGYLSQNVSELLRADLLRYGQFNIHYAPKNLWVMLLAGPLWEPTTNRPIPSVDGMSVLLTMPVLWLLLNARKPRMIVAAGAASLLLLLVPLVMYYNTGWWQFGYRFFLDLLAPIVLVLGLALANSQRWLMRAMIAFGIAVNAWGTWWFLNNNY